jgi:hypothetical protein
MTHCAICGQEMTSWVYVCRSCYSKYDLDSEWVKELINAERNWRTLDKREERIGVITFSDLQIYQDGELYDGWDLIDGEIGYGKSSTHPINVFHEKSIFRFNTETEDIQRRCEIAKLTEGETQAILVQSMYSFRGKLKSEEGAKYLSEMVGKQVSPAAFRRRLSDGRKKLKKAGLHR